MTGERILIVEDESIVAMDLKGMLSGLGYEVLAVAEDATGAVEAALETKPDLILMDIMLKNGSSGIDAARRIRERADNMAIIYITAYSNDSTLDDARKTMPYGYIIKPYTEREIASTLEIAFYRIKMERKLNRLQRWMISALNSMGDGVIASDMDGKVWYMNDIAERLTGWSSDAAVGIPIQEVMCLIDEDTGNPMDDMTSRVKEEGTIIGLPETAALVRPDGDNIAIDATGALIKTPGEEPTGVVVVFHDVSEQKLEKLVSSETQGIYRAIVKSSPKLISVINSDGTVRFDNPAVFHLLGYQIDQRIGKSILDLVSREDAPAVEDGLRNILDGSSIIDLHSVDVLLQGGGQMSMKCILYRFEDHGPLTGIVMECTPKK